VRIWNPYPSPRKNKTLTREQVEGRQEKAVRFAEDVLDDPDLADELEGLTVEEYAERKGYRLSNPTRKVVNTVKREEVVQKLKEELKPVLKDLVTEAVKEARPNPAAAIRRLRHKIDEVPEDEREELLDKFAEIEDALADGRLDRAQQIVGDALDEYGDEDEGDDEGDE
jgi:hypothetical protein